MNGLLSISVGPVYWSVRFSKLTEYEKLSGANEKSVMFFSPIELYRKLMLTGSLWLPFNISGLESENESCLLSLTERTVISVDWTAEPEYAVIL